MKVLFAVSNENISESIVKKYQKEYKEIISYKNVYYFNAILKEIQKDKSYDRIIISEDLEPFSNNNYDVIDRFLFEKLDSISDEATNSERNDTPIILICSDRREKSEDMLVKLFGIGIYNAIIGQDRSIDEICRLIKTPRTKKEAKLYYKIDSEDVNYQSENENDVSETEIQNILAHYKKLGKNEEKYVESFNNIASQYTDTQLKLISSFLPLNVRAVLESNSIKYQQLMTSNGGIPLKSISKIKSEKKEGIKVDFLETKNNQLIGNKQVIIPTAVDTNKVKKLSQQNKEEVQEEIEPIKIDETKRRGRPKKKIEENTIEEEIEPIKIDETKKRGRPKKKIEEDFEEKEENFGKNNLYNLVDEDEDLNQSNVVLPGINDEEKFEDDYRNSKIEPIKYNDPKFYESKIEPNNIKFSDNNIDNKEILNSEISNTEELENLLTNDKKIVSFVGTSKNGTSFLINNLAIILSEIGINTAILDVTKNKNSYYIYTKNEEELRKVALESIEKLNSGMAQGIKVNKNLSVYTSIPNEEKNMASYEKILSTLIQNHSLVLIDCDFDTNLECFANSQEIYLVQSMDVLTIQPLTAFLRELKAKNILKQNKIKIVINKETKVRSLGIKTIIGGMSFYNDPTMSFMTELFDRNNVRYCTIPFDEDIYSRYLEGLVNCRISLNGYSKGFMQSLQELGNMVYPLIDAKKAYKKFGNYNINNFSNDMNNTLENMKKKY